MSLDGGDTFVFVALGGHWYIHTHRMHSRSVGDRSYMARMLGTDKRFRFRREFVGRTLHKGAREQFFGPLVEGAVYEYRHLRSWAEQSGHSYLRGGVSGYMRFAPEGDEGLYFSLTAAEAIAAAHDLDRQTVEVAS